MRNRKVVSVLGYDVFNESLSSVNVSEEWRTVINCMSPNSYGLAKKDEEFKSALKNTDILVLDGVYFALASIILHGKNIKRNQGPDVFYNYMEELNRINGRAFFLGSTNTVLEKVMERTKRQYPSITAASFSPPFKNQFSDEDNDLMIEKINNFKPDILFVGMTCPKQEKWSIKHKESVNSRLIICIGNVFDWYAGTQKRIHPFWFKIRLGWLVRIFIRPEIFKRNIANQMTFFKDVLLILLRIRK